MAAKQNSIVNDGQATSEDIPLTSLEKSLLSLEKLDRASPELWPEQSNYNDCILNIKLKMGDGNNNLSHSIEESHRSNDSFAVPGVSEFANLQNTNQSPPSWEGLTKEDYTYMQQLGSLSTSGLIMEVKRLHDLAYQLGLEEAKEMTRGKYLNIFSSRRQR